MKNLFQVNVEKSENLFARNGSKMTCNKLINRIEYPTISDFDLLDAIRINLRKYEKETDVRNLKEIERKLDFLLGELSVFNLSSIDSKIF
jgi:hypothetical protein